MTQENKESNSQGGKLDNTFPDGVGKPGGDEAVITEKNSNYDYSQKLAPHFAEIADTMNETAMYGGHGIAAREAGIDIPSDSDHDGDYDTPSTT
jgi:hypothetical protein